MNTGKIKRTIFTDTIMGDTCFRFGRMDAVQGYPCQPLEYFREADAIVHYTLGYQEVAGETEETKALLQKWDSPEVNKTYVPVDWEMLYLDDKLETWLPVSERTVKDHLLESRLDVNTSLGNMRATPGLEVICLRAKFRYCVQEASHANPQ